MRRPRDAGAATTLRAPLRAACLEPADACNELHRRVSAERASAQPAAQESFGNHAHRGSGESALLLSTRVCAVSKQGGRASAESARAKE